MKIVISFIAGIVACSLMLIGARSVLPSLADTSGDTTDNTSNGLVDLLPDIEKIYRESLLLPYEKAESKIYDPEIREYFHDLMNATGLGSYPED